MSQGTTVSLDPQASSRDVLTHILNEGAQRLLAAALNAEVEEYLQRFERARDERGHRVVVRNGYLPERTIQTGIGAVRVAQPRVEDRRPSDEREPFTSKILPPYLRRTKSMEDLIPWLYLKGISTQDFPEALSALLGPQAKGLSANTITRIKDVWASEYASWNRRSLAGKRYVYLWVDGIYFNVRLEEDRSCILVVMGATADGKKELVAVHDGVRESEQSWLEVLTDLKARGLKNGPDLAIGDGALGFWAALPKAFAKCRVQRCWVHKTMNVLNGLPKKLQPSAKEKLHQIWMAQTRKDAQAAFDAFVATYQAKHPKAVECLLKDQDALLAFYDFPAEHWAHLRTTNPIESAFATVRLRTHKTKGCGTRQATLAMVFKLAQVAEKRWRKLNGHKLLEDVIRGIRFVDGIKENAA
ncbi:MAG: IS256 family transposase [Planctomycetota bacterium]|nr:IS256 family transposase [Planctomycetota bacterium]MCZ7645823.1 IS256 family transposase [Planctomycetota bacterium]MCZ7646022.1 IS256 family transposase [Planctomycetota bacterium]MCZ7648931.1 IS256 family transposase [Planctomycetota bacterium]MCZ7648952.1 IS256 family transposase [Planctomycetota bacterium]